MNKRNPSQANNLGRSVRSIQSMGFTTVQSLNQSLTRPPKRNHAARLMPKAAAAQAFVRLKNSNATASKRRENVIDIKTRMPPMTDTKNIRRPLFSRSLAKSRSAAAKKAAEISKKAAIGLDIANQ